MGAVLCTGAQVICAKLSRRVHFGILYKCVHCILYSCVYCESVYIVHFRGIAVNSSL